MKYILKGSVDERKFYYNSYVDKYYHDFYSAIYIQDCKDAGFIVHIDNSIEWKEVGELEHPAKLAKDDKVFIDNNVYKVVDIFFNSDGTTTCLINKKIKVIEDLESKLRCEEALERDQKILEIKKKGITVKEEINKHKWWQFWK